MIEDIRFNIGGPKVTMGPTKLSAVPNSSIGLTIGGSLFFKDDIGIVAVIQRTDEESLHFDTIVIGYKEFKL